MKQIVALTLFVTSAFAYAQPSKDVIETCVQNESSSPQVKYTEIRANSFEIARDEDTKETETTFRYGKDVIGTWETSAPASFGLIYKGKRIPLNRVVRLSNEEPSDFNPLLAMWGAVHKGSKSYICVTFNFEGLGQSGSYQSVRGVYLIERGAGQFRPFYTVGRVTPEGVVLAK